jgi:hypothetical protein
MNRPSIPVSFTLVLAAFATALPASAQPGRPKCRTILPEIRAGAPMTRELAVKELLRARADGEMDFHIATPAPASTYPICSEPPAVPDAGAAPDARGAPTPTPVAPRPLPAASAARLG